MARIAHSTGGQLHVRLPSIDLPNIFRRLPNERMLTRISPRNKPKVETGQTETIGVLSGLKRATPMLAAVALGFLAQDCRTQDRTEPIETRNAGSSQMDDLLARNLPYLDSENRDIRNIAFRQLAEKNLLSAAQRTQFLERTLVDLTDPNPQIRYYAVSFLARLMDLAEFPLDNKAIFLDPLTASLRDNENSVRGEAARALRLATLNNLSLDQARRIEGPIGAALITRDPAALKDLLGALVGLANDFPEEIKPRVIQRLKTEVLYGVGEGFRSEVGKHLKSLIDDPTLDKMKDIFRNVTDITTRINAGQFLMSAAKLQIDDALFALGRETEPAFLVQLMNYILDNVSRDDFTARSTDLLIGLAEQKLQSDDPGVRERAAFILCKWWEKWAADGVTSQKVNMLIAALNDPTQEVRLSSAKILRQLLGAGLVDPDKLEQLSRIMICRMTLESPDYVMGYGLHITFSDIQIELSEALLSLPQSVKVSINIPHIVGLFQASINDEAQAAATVRTFPYDLFLFLPRVPQEADSVKLIIVDPKGVRWEQNCGSWGDIDCGVSEGLNMFRIFLSTNSPQVTAYLTYSKEGIGISRSAEFIIENPDAILP